jgi:lysophospholipase L1-like esterase
LDNPCVIEGLRITKQLLLLTQSETNASGVKLLILLIPTQETVYAEVVETSHSQLTPTYTKLVQMEARVRAKIISLCKENDIQYVDALPSLAEAVQRDEEIYPHYIDGHPLPRGYFLIASAVNEALNTLGWLE